tara:strand:+ start:769 stop:1515 length:747 start_codon:yes stop_codon:yes gene_type:complete
MDELDHQELMRVKELLNRTGEFIAYFELVESKMAEWRVNLEQQAKAQEKQFHQQLEVIQQEMSVLQDTLSAAGLAKFRISAETSVRQGQEHLKALDTFLKHFLKTLDSEKDDIKKITQTCLSRLENHTKKCTQAIDNQLSIYDIDLFSKSMYDKTHEIEKTTNQAVSTSQRLLKNFHWRTAGLSVVITLLTALTVGLYMNDELPWEIHKHAMNERQAGQLLMNAWAKLSHKERLKILGEQKSPNINRA